MVASKVIQFQVYEERDDLGKRIIQLFVLTDTGFMYRGQVHTDGTIDWQQLDQAPALQ